MNLLQLTNKLEKGKNLGAEVVYIKEDNIISGIGSVYKDQENKNITISKCKDETIKVDDFLKILKEIHANLGDGDVSIGSSDLTREINSEIRSLEFAQYELVKMIFINI